MNGSKLTYAPKEKPGLVCKPNEFVFAAIALDHGHIYGMCNGLVQAGGTLKYVYDPDPGKIKQFVEKFPYVTVCRSADEILQDPEIRLVASAAVTSERGPLGLEVMSHGKDYFTDKAPFTTLEQLEAAKRKVNETGLKYAVYYSERLHVESAVFAEQLINEGAIGKVIQVIGFGPHRVSAPTRPEWFFQREKFGGILCDIGSHQVEQFLFYTGAKDAKLLHSKIANYAHKQYPEFEDFGDATFLADNGATGYFRVDWFTPDGLSSWGDGRLTILGTKGYIELRKNLDLARDSSGGHVYLVNDQVTEYYHVLGKVGYPYFGRLILDCLNRTEHAMTQEHAFKAAELCLIAQQEALRID
ncbi:MAG: putative dehydrogenase [Paenibacillus sp.]|jgi:predicted dehydrogenase|nr:putative dehydrogenase [Paenibacillus sp.]